MPYNQPKNYKYIPTFNSSSDKPKIQCYSVTKARKEVGGTFFRSLKTGKSQNLIRLTLTVEQGSFESGGTPGPSILIVETDGTKNTQAGVSFSGKSGKVGSLSILKMKTPIVETVTVTAINSTQFSVNGTVSGDMGTIRIGGRFVSTDKLLIFSITRKPTSLLVTNSYSVGDTYTFTTGPDIEIFTIDTDIPDDLRTAVNGVSKLIEMPTDDDFWNGQDAVNLIPFEKEYLEGADGLPETPSSTRTGPERAFIQVNYIEGEGRIYKIFEWVGDSGSNGSWQKYI